MDLYQCLEGHRRHPSMPHDIYHAQHTQAAIVNTSNATRRHDTARHVAHPSLPHAYIMWQTELCHRTFTKGQTRIPQSTFCRTSSAYFKAHNKQHSLELQWAHSLWHTHACNMALTYDTPRHVTWQIPYMSEPSMPWCTYSLTHPNVRTCITHTPLSYRHTQCGTSRQDRTFTKWHTKEFQKAYTVWHTKCTTCQIVNSPSCNYIGHMAHLSMPQDTYHMAHACMHQGTWHMTHLGTAKDSYHMENSNAKEWAPHGRLTSHTVHTQWPTEIVSRPGGSRSTSLRQDQGFKCQDSLYIYICISGLYACFIFSFFILGFHSRPFLLQHLDAHSCVLSDIQFSLVLCGHV